MFKNILQLLCVLLVLSNAARANDLHLKIPEKAYEVLEPKPAALTLDAVQEKVVNDHLDIQISFEKLLQAQKKISEARAQFFPYGAGTIAAMYFLNIWNPLVLVELVTSIPSKVFDVQTEKNLAKAQKYNNVALKENIKNQVAHLYYNILKEESALKISKLEIALLESLMRVFQERIRLGLSTEDDVRSLNLRLLDLRDAYLRFNSYLIAEKAAFNMMLTHNPEEAKNIELQTVTSPLESEQYQLDVNALVETAIKNSPELVAANYMITAASKGKKSAKWSVLSFNGIGFSYWGRVKIAGSKVKDAKLNHELVEDTLINHVHVKHNAFERSLDFLNSEQQLLEETAFYTESEIEQYKSQAITLDVLLETELLFLTDFRKMVLAHYDAFIKLNDLERATLSTLATADTSVSNFEVKLDHLKRKRYTISLKGSELKEVDKVEYVFDDGAGLNDVSSSSARNKFRVALKLYNPDRVSGVAHITFKNGQTVTQQFKF